MRLGLRNGTLELIDHQNEWEKIAEEKINVLMNLFGDLVISIEHIGSTSIKTIKAKPIIDLVMGIKDFNNIENLMKKMENSDLKYCPKNDGQESKMFIIGELNGILTFIVHLVEYNGEEWNNKINFRDFMNNNLEKAKEYETLKLELIKNAIWEKNNIHSNYHMNKEQFINEKINEANNWRKELIKNGKTST
jgi:GrpB-like predicted nucleotidyltransferase (UPF0157 family)